MKKPATRAGQGLDLREGIRCTTAERDQCVDKLQAALAAGALPQEIALARIERALTAAMVNDLYALTTDLRDHRPPPPRPVPSRSPHRAHCQRPHAPWVTAWGAWVSLGLAAWAAVTTAVLWYGIAAHGFSDSSATSFPAAAAGIGVLSVIAWALTTVLVATSLVEHISYCLRQRRKCHGRRKEPL